MKKYPKKTVLYSSFNEDHDGGSLKAKAVGGEYRYIRRGAFHRILHFFFYRIVATPLAVFHKLFVGREKVHGKEKLKQAAGGGYFVYANHTQGAADAFSPNLAVFPKRAYTVVNSKNLSVGFFGKCLHYMGALPVPTELSGIRNFTKAISERVSENGVIIIYPEAHLWPYATFLRPFGEESFTYPVRCKAPAYTFTRVYRKKKNGYKTEIYIDGPFYPNPNVSDRVARTELCEAVRAAMQKRCELSDIEIVRYEKADI